MLTSLSKREATQLVLSQSWLCFTATSNCIYSVHFGLPQENKPDRLTQRQSVVPWDNSEAKKVSVAMYADHAC